MRFNTPDDPFRGLNPATDYRNPPVARKADPFLRKVMRNIFPLVEEPKDGSYIMYFTASKLVFDNRPLEDALRDARYRIGDIFQVEFLNGELVKLHRLVERVSEAAESIRQQVDEYLKHEARDSETSCQLCGKTKESLIAVEIGFQCWDCYNGTEPIDNG